jgi:hypothetical protein
VKQISVIPLLFTFVIASGLLWLIYKSIKKNKLPSRTDYTPFDDMMSGRVGKDPLSSFMQQKDEDEKQ